MSEAASDDVRAIRELIDRQLASMTWPTGAGPDLACFMADFLPSAPLYASARPVSAQTLEQFCERMRALSRTSLTSFHERAVATTVHVFGNVAVAAAVCENTENGAEVSRNVEMLLLVKDGGHWRIAAQAWDRETADRPVSRELLSGA